MSQTCNLVGLRGNKKSKNRGKGVYCVNFIVQNPYRIGIH